MSAVFLYSRSPEVLAAPLALRNESWRVAGLSPQHATGCELARELVRKDYGRIAFGCAELQGYQTWVAAYLEGKRAMLQVAG